MSLDRGGISVICYLLTRLCRFTMIMANISRGMTRRYHATPSIQNMAVSSMREWLTDMCRLSRCSSSWLALDSSISRAMIPAP